MGMGQGSGMMNLTLGQSRQLFGLKGKMRTDTAG
jgi:hypothetical protein